MTKQKIINLLKLEIELGLEIEEKEKEILKLKNVITNKLLKADSIATIYSQVDFLASDSCADSIPRLKQYLVELKQLHEKKKLIESIKG